MASLPTHTDPTLDAVNRAIAEKENAEDARLYLGASSIGRPCERELWYSFRLAFKNWFDAETHRRFIDGHRTEDLEAERLRMVPGVQLWTHENRSGKQYGVQAVGGHFRGHLDGIIKGLLQAPATTHVWECKATNEKKQAKLESLILTIGEKQALEKWDAVYYAQALVYMHLKELTRHYLTCTTPGGRHTISVRTNANSGQAETVLNKAERIVTAATPPAKLRDDPAYFQCKWCNASDICHQRKMPNVNCRTCAHATPELDGNARWTCARYGNQDIPAEFQRQGCNEHLFIPDLLVGCKPINASEEENWIAYESPEKIMFINGQQPGHYTSKELFNLGSIVKLNEDIDALKKPLPEQFCQPTATGVPVPFIQKANPEPYLVLNVNKDYLISRGMDPASGRVG